MTAGLSLSRHDVSLAAIAVSLAVAAVFALVSPVGYAVALTAGSVPATGSIGYSLFYRPPKTRESA